MKRRGITTTLDDPKDKKPLRLVLRQKDEQNLDKASTRPTGYANKCEDFEKFNCENNRRFHCIWDDNKCKNINDIIQEEYIIAIQNAISASVEVINPALIPLPELTHAEELYLIEPNTSLEEDDRDFFVHTAKVETEDSEKKNVKNGLNGSDVKRIVDQIMSQEKKKEEQQKKRKECMANFETKMNDVRERLQKEELQKKLKIDLLKELKNKVIQVEDNIEDAKKKFKEKIDETKNDVKEKIEDESQIENIDEHVETIQRIGSIQTERITRISSTLINLYFNSIIHTQAIIENGIENVSSQIGNVNTAIRRGTENARGTIVRNIDNYAPAIVSSATSATRTIIQIGTVITIGSIVVAGRGTATIANIAGRGIETISNTVGRTASTFTRTIVNRTEETYPIVRQGVGRIGQAFSDIARLTFFIFISIITSVAVSSVNVARNVGENAFVLGAYGLETGAQAVVNSSRFILPAIQVSSLALYNASGYAIREGFILFFNILNLLFNMTTTTVINVAYSIGERIPDIMQFIHYLFTMSIQYGTEVANVGIDILELLFEFLLDSGIHISSFILSYLIDYVFWLLVELSSLTISATSRIISGITTSLQRLLRRALTRRGVDNTEIERYISSASNTRARDNGSGENRNGNPPPVLFDILASHRFANNSDEEGRFVKEHFTRGTVKNKDGKTLCRCWTKMGHFCSFPATANGKCFKHNAIWPCNNPPSDFRGGKRRISKKNKKISKKMNFKKRVSKRRKIGSRKRFIL
jgi:hypothetical protein